MSMTLWVYSREMLFPSKEFNYLTANRQRFHTLPTMHLGGSITRSFPQFYKDLVLAPGGPVKYDIVHMHDQAFSKQPLRNEYGSLPKNGDFRPLNTSCAVCQKTPLFTCFSGRACVKCHT